MWNLTKLNFFEKSWISRANPCLRISCKQNWRGHGPGPCCLVWTVSGAYTRTQQPTNKSAMKHILNLFLWSESNEILNSSNLLFNPVNGLKKQLFLKNRPLVKPSPKQWNQLKICPPGDFGMLKLNLRSKTFNFFTQTSKWRKTTSRLFFLSVRRVS